MCENEQKPELEPEPCKKRAPEPEPHSWKLRAPEPWSWKKSSGAGAASFIRSLHNPARDHFVSIKLLLR